jgi:general secretion pathway protein E/type IV pilus assembly protein PilB
MAVRAAMTGHQVYATLHANNVFGAVPRLLDIGVEKSILASNIIGILAQRLVRKLCAHCRQVYEASEFEKQLMGISVKQSVQLHKACGCAKCNHTGYKGRVSVVEVLRFDADLDELVLAGKSGSEFMQAAKDKGFQSMAQMGFRLVRQGITSLDELSRVIDLTEYIGNL